MENSIPVLTPLLALFHSRRFIVAVCTLIAGLLTIAVPSLLPVRDVILVLITTLALAVIGGYSVSDASTNARDVATQPVPDTSSLLKDILGQLLDAGLLNQLPQEGQLARLQVISAPLQAIEGTEIKLDHFVAPDGSIVSLPAGSKLTAINKTPTGFHSLSDVDYLKSASKED